MNSQLLRDSTRTPIQRGSEMRLVNDRCRTTRIGAAHLCSTRGNFESGMEQTEHWQQTLASRNSSWFNSTEVARSAAPVSKPAPAKSPGSLFAKLESTDSAAPVLKRGEQEHTCLSYMKDERRA